MFSPNLPKSVEYDQEIMSELLRQPGVREEVLKMTSGELSLFKRLLVTQGTYARYCKEREAE